MQNHCNAVLECLQYDTIALWQWVEFFYQMMHVFKNCLCICCHSSTGLSYFSTVSKWLNMASNFCHVVAHNLSVLIPNIDETVIGSSMLNTGEIWKIYDFWPVSRCRGSETSRHAHHYHGTCYNLRFSGQCPSDPRSASCPKFSSSSCSRREPLGNVNQC